MASIVQPGGAGVTCMACGMNFDEGYGDSVDLDRYCGSIAGMVAQGMTGVELFARME